MTNLVRVAVCALKYRAASGDESFVSNTTRIQYRTIQFTRVDVNHPLHRAKRKVIRSAIRHARAPRVRRRLVAESIIERSIRVPTYDIALAHMVLPRRVDKPVIWSTQGVSADEYYRYVSNGQLSSRDVADVYARLSHRADMLLVWTESGASRLADACPAFADRICIVHPPVFGPDVEPTKNVSSGLPVRMLFVGMDGHRKGLDLLADALAKMQDLRADWHVDVVTDATRGRATVDRLAALGALVHGVASRAVVNQMMLDSDVFVLPSRADSYGMAVVEAMSMGCVPVTSRLEPFIDIVGSTGLASTQQGLTDALRNLVVNRDQLTSLQHSAFSRYRQRHHPNVFAESFLALSANLGVA